MCEAHNIIVHGQTVVEAFVTENQEFHHVIRIFVWDLFRVLGFVA